MAKKAAMAEIVQPDSPEVELVRLEGTTIQQWVNDARLFFRRATELELSAKAHLVRAEGLKVPTSGDQDAQLQDFIRMGNAGKKEAQQHWTIKGVLDKLHKRAVQGERRTTDAYDQATTIGNSLHNQFTANERRRVQEEQARIDREALERQQRIRDQELADLEAQALKAEGASSDLSSREQAFVADIVSGVVGGRAAQRAGFKEPDKAAMRLLGLVKIQNAIEAARTARNIRQQAQAVKAAPLDPVSVEEVRPDIAVDTRERTTHSADLLNERALIEAILTGGQGIPSDLLMISQPKLNEYARSLHALINRWPGVRYKAVTKVL